MDNMNKVRCPYCGELAARVTGREIYPHLEKLYRKRYWVCYTCDAYVGCHPNGTPLGCLANANLRRVRRATHSMFDSLWQQGKLTRDQAYAWLSKSLGLPISECHIGMFDEKTCQKVQELFKK
jgi:hypothetical protein